MRGDALWGSSYFCERGEMCAIADGAFEGMGKEVGKEEWEQRRVFEGVCKVGREIDAGITPLECGLWHLVSFEKGCYIGQETIARLDTYDGVKRRVCLMEFEARVEEGMRLGATPGEVVTSVGCVDGVWRALGRVRREVCVGDEVVAQGVRGVVVETNYLRYLGSMAAEGEGVGGRLS